MHEAEEVLDVVFPSGDEAAEVVHPRMDPSFQAEAVISAGRGALIVAMFGAGWFG
jgi:hypothetical protein